jgi:hypothetical protein
MAVGSYFKRFGANNNDRDYYDTLGYLNNITYADFLAKYKRQDLAFRIVNAFPEATWSQPPEVYETEDLQVNTEFETKWRT